MTIVKEKKQFQVNCALNKEQYILLLKYCKKNNITPYRLLKDYLIRKCNLPDSNIAFYDVDSLSERIRQLED